jgi:hypothetical protein
VAGVPAEVKGAASRLVLLVLPLLLQLPHDLAAEGKVQDTLQTASKHREDGCHKKVILANRSITIILSRLVPLA